MDVPDERLLRALRQASESANDRRRWQPLRSAGLQSVEPVLFLWGINSGDSGSTLPTLAADLTGYEGTKGSLHFPVDQPLPASLVNRLVTTRMRGLGLL